MEYELDMGIWHAVFAVPADIVDQHIKTCGAASLRAILLVLRGGRREINVDSIAAALGIPPADARDALNYWVNCGVIKSSYGGDPTPAPEAPAREPAFNAGIQPKSPVENHVENHPTPLPSYTPPKPNMEQVAKLVAEDPSVAFLIQEAEAHLGKYLSQGNTATLVHLYDWAGIPVDVILMVIEYCRSIGKSSMNYIEKTALNWMERGIDTHEKAEHHIRKLMETNDWEKQVKTAFGLFERQLIQKEKDMIRVWYGEYGFTLPLIRLAYERTIENIGKLSFPYINSILKAWHEKGIKTPAQAAEEQLSAPAQPVQGKQQEAGRAPSYDIDEVEKMITFGHLDS